MPRINPTPLRNRIALNRKQRREGVFVAPPVYPSQRAEMAYRRDLYELINAIVERVTSNVIPQLFRFEDQYILEDASFAILIRNSIKAVKALFFDVTPTAEEMAGQMVNTEYEEQSSRFDNAMEAVTGGISMERIVRKEQLVSTLEAKIAENVSLIQSIPDQYFKELEGMIFRNITAGNSANSIVQEIRDLTGATLNRAELIARDQTSKTSAAINQERQSRLGVTEYVWQTSRDQRVRPSHKEKQGKVFKWSDPPRDTGHPANDINCRCTARAVVEL